MHHNNIVGTLKIHLCPSHIEQVLRLPGAVSSDVSHNAFLRNTLAAPEGVDTENWSQSQSLVIIFARVGQSCSKCIPCNCKKTLHKAWAKQKLQGRLKEDNSKKLEKQTIIVGQIIDSTDTRVKYKTCCKLAPGHQIPHNTAMNNQVYGTSNSNQEIYSSSEGGQKSCQK